MATISSDGTTKQKPRLHLDDCFCVRENYPKARKEMNILKNDPHQDMLTQIDSMLDNISQ
jgi:hypothetical protein